MSGLRPEVTKAQIIAAIGAGVPVLVNLLAAFGIFSPTPAEQHALTEATKWAIAFAGLLVLGDAHLRGKRNEADAAKAVAQASVANAANGNTHSDPGPVGVDVARRSLAAVADHPLGLPEHRPMMADDEPEPAVPVEPDELDLADPALDDPEAETQAGISRLKLGEHYAHAAETADLLERDERIGASA